MAVQLLFLALSISSNVSDSRKNVALERAAMPLSPAGPGNPRQQR